MFAVLYAVAVVMVAGGAFAILAGWELLLLERGWSMVISGATLATGGLVLGGVAAAARALATRLDALAEAVRASRPAPAPIPRRPAATASDTAEAPPFAEPPPPGREIEPKLPPREPAAPAGPAPVAALGIGGVATEALAPGRQDTPPEPEGGLPPLDLDEKGDVGEADAGEQDVTEQDVTEQDVAHAETGPAAAGAPPPAPEVATEPEPETEPEADEGAPEIAAPGIEQPVLAPREPGRIAAEAEALTRRYEESAPPIPVPPPAAPPASDALEAGPLSPAADSARAAVSRAVDESVPPGTPSYALAPAAAEAAPADAPDAHDAEIGESPDEAGLDRDTPPHIVGTHVSGANRYVMYSDGSIEAETPDGRLVFGSIEELKGYVASSGEDPSGASQTGPR
ncbi:MAG: hypothetical protein ACFE0R_01860 [Salinarimonas sp.]